MFENVNWLAVLGAAIAAFAVGAIWYGPLFGKRWAQLIGVNMDAPGTPLAPILAVNFVMDLLAATALAVLVGGFAADAVTAAFIGGLVWIPGMALKLNDLMFARRPAALFYIDSIGHLVALVVMAVIVSTFRI